MVKQSGLVTTHLGFVVNGAPIDPASCLCLALASSYLEGERQHGSGGQLKTILCVLPRSNRRKTSPADNTDQFP